MKKIIPISAVICILVFFVIFSQNRKSEQEVPVIEENVSVEEKTDILVYKEPEASINEEEYIQREIGQQKVLNAAAPGYNDETEEEPIYYDEELSSHYYRARDAFLYEDYIAAIYHASYVLNYQKKDTPKEYIHRCAVILMKSKAKFHIYYKKDTDKNYLFYLKKYIPWYKSSFKVWYEKYRDVDVESAFRLWEEALDYVVTFSFTDNPNDADILIYFNTSKAKNCMGEYNDQIAGCTMYDHTKYFMTKATIYMTTPKKIKDDKKSQIETFSTLLHEIAHALGIQGHSPDKEDIMYYTDNSAEYPSQSDIDTVKALYER